MAFDCTSQEKEAHGYVVYAVQEVSKASVKGGSNRAAIVPEMNVVVWSPVHARLSFPSTIVTENMQWGRHACQAPYLTTPTNLFAQSNRVSIRYTKTPGTVIEPTFPTASSNSHLILETIDLSKYAHSRTTLAVRRCPILLSSWFCPGWFRSC